MAEAETFDVYDVLCQPSLIWCADKLVSQTLAVTYSGRRPSMHLFCFSVLALVPQHQREVVHAR